jgi:hypothetical protein
VLQDEIGPDKSFKELSEGLHNCVFLAIPCVFSDVVRRVAW